MINDERNLITLEDPVEIELPGVAQVQVSDKTGMTFAAGLRSALRQDPDVIMVGEIRDQITRRAGSARGPHRSPRAVDPAHERLRVGSDPPRGDGCAELPRRVVADPVHGAAARAQAVQRGRVVHLPPTPTPDGDSG